LVDKLAFGLGLVLTPAFALAKLDLALLLGSVLAGTLAYVAHRGVALLREAAADPPAAAQPTENPGEKP
jgi:hypothetical protein